MIQVHNLSKTYNGTTVLNIEELHIPKGQSFGLVGNNGAGKTTFFSLLLDLIRPSTGEIQSKGVLVSKSEEWKTFTTAFLDETFLIGYLTPEEYFYFIGELYGMNKGDVDTFLKKYEAFFNGEVLNQKKYLRDFSKGNQKKVGIVSAFIGNPEVVVLDEPFANLDPTTQIRLKNLVKEIKEEGKITILISSHDLQHTLEVSDRIVALEKGRVVKDVLATETSLQEIESFFALQD